MADRTIKTSPFNADAWLAAADQRRKRLKLTPLTESALRKMKAKGRI
jgi:hypothetical protein